MQLRDGGPFKCCLNRGSNVAVAANVVSEEEENTLENGEADEEEECFVADQDDNGNGGVAERPLR